jgi:hypothetical protein
MYLVTSKNPTGQIRRAIAASLHAASDLANRMRSQNPLGIVVIERPNGATIVGEDETSGHEDTQTLQVGQLGWA